jgi:hypothetical protein
MSQKIRLHRSGSRSKSQKAIPEPIQSPIASRKMAR